MIGPNPYGTYAQSPQAPTQPGPYPRPGGGAGTTLGGPGPYPAPGGPYSAQLGPGPYPAPGPTQPGPGPYPAPGMGGTNAPQLPPPTRHPGDTAVWPTPTFPTTAGVTPMASIPWGGAPDTPSPAPGGQPGTPFSGSFNVNPQDLRSALLGLFNGPTPAGTLLGGGTTAATPGLR